MKNFNKYLVEFIGTFFLVLVVALTGNPLAIGGFLIAMVYAGGAVSGAHYNPAVTLGIYLSGKISQKEALRYVGVQMLAGVVASAVYWLIQQGGANGVNGPMFLPAPAANVAWLTALLVEILFTFLLVHTILRVAVSNKTKNNQYFGLAIGLALMVGAFAGGPISGGAYNPAVGVGPQLFDIAHIANHLSEIVLYTLGPVLGAMLASYVFTQSGE